MLLLAYLITRNEQWGDARIRLLAGNDPKMGGQTLDSLHGMLEEIRIEAEPILVENPDADAIAEYSGDSGLVLLPFRLKSNRVCDPFGNPMAETLFLLPVVAMVMAAEDIDLDAEPEEGEAGRRAKLMDALDRARRMFARAAKRAEDAAEAAQKARQKAQEIKTDADTANTVIIDKAELAAIEAEKLADELARKAAKAAFKAESAAREAEDSGILLDEIKEEV
jgi:hypothetical protein